MIPISFKDNTSGVFCSKNGETHDFYIKEGQIRTSAKLKESDKQEILKAHKDFLKLCIQEKYNYIEKNIREMSDILTVWEQYGHKDALSHVKSCIGDINTFAEHLQNGGKLE